jgi:hypothetical protein
MTDPSPDTFAAVTALIALISDPKGCAKRLAELQAKIAAAERAQTQFEAAQPVHDQAAAALEAREIAVTEREQRVDAAELRLLRELPRERFPLGANGEAGTRTWSGLVRE